MVTNDVLTCRYFCHRMNEQRMNAKRVKKISSKLQKLNYYFLLLLVISYETGLIKLHEHRTPNIKNENKQFSRKPIVHVRI